MAIKDYKNWLVILGSTPYIRQEVILKIFLKNLQIGPARFRHRNPSTERTSLHQLRVVALPFENQIQWQVVTSSICACNDSCCCRTRRCNGLGFAIYWGYNVRWPMFGLYTGLIQIVYILGLVTLIIFFYNLLQIFKLLVISLWS